MGNRLSITFPGGVRQWTLEPQVQMGGCRPDFVLRSSQGGLPAVAIFTDGWLYHASPAHNRIADDARKRQDLRDSGVIVARHHRAGRGAGARAGPSRRPHG